MSRSIVHRRVSRVRRGGFTVFELLVVLAIVIVLAAIAMPHIGAMANTGADLTIRNELPKLRAALQAYYAANGQYPPSQDWTTGATAVNYTPPPGYMAAWTTGPTQQAVEVWTGRTRDNAQCHYTGSSAPTTPTCFAGFY